MRSKERLKARCSSCWRVRLPDLRRGAVPDCEDARRVPAVGVLGAGGMEVKDADVEEEIRTPRRENCSDCGSGRGFPLLLLSPGSEKEFSILFIFGLYQTPPPPPMFPGEGKAKGKPLCSKWRQRQAL